MSIKDTESCSMANCPLGKYYDSDAERANNVEWRELMLKEIRDLKVNFQDFKIEVKTIEAERKGRNGIIAAGISLIVSLLVAFIHGFSGGNR